MVTKKSSLIFIIFFLILPGACKNNLNIEENIRFNEDGNEHEQNSVIYRKLLALSDLSGLKEKYLVEINKEFWQTADPEEPGLNQAALDRHLQFCKDTGADSVLVVYQNKIVQEWYASEDRREPHNVQSITKSIAGILTGMLIDDGKIPSIYEPVSTYVPGWDEGDKQDVTIYNLLSMTAGFKRMRSEGLGSTHEKDAYAAGLSLEYTPGTVFEYSNEGAQLLSQILCKAAGQSLAEYAEERLFSPLGMTDTKLRTDDRGCVWTYSGMETTVRDLAKIGVLMMNKGMWGQVQIVSEEWVEMSTKRSQEMYNWYGFLWWLIKNPGGFAGMGGYDNYFGIFPEAELIVVRIQEAPKAGIEMYQYEGRAGSFFLEFFEES